MSEEKHTPGADPALSCGADRFGFDSRTDARLILEKMHALIAKAEGGE